MGTKRIVGWIFLLGGSSLAVWQAIAALIFAAFFYGWPSVETGDTYYSIALIVLGLSIAVVGLILLRGARVTRND